MKKYVNPAPIPPGGLPLYAGEFIPCLQTELYRAILAPYLQYNEPVIINGCTAVANTGAGTVAIAAGMALLDGDLIDVPAYNGTYPVYLAQDAPLVTNKLYKDNISRAVTTQAQSHWIPAAPGAGDYIMFDPYTSQYLRDVKRRYETPVGAFLGFATYPDINSFDFTGLGRWAWKGFAIAIGYNGTVNMTGRVLAQYDALSAKLYLGALYGEETHQLTVQELAKHSHATDMKSGIASTGGTIGGQGPPGSGRTSDEGGDQPHNNIQPTYAGVILQRIAV